MGSLMAILAHPDDETFICGGAIAKAVKMGTKVVLVCATKGEMGRRMGTPPVHNRESISRVRESELRVACDILGIGRLHLLGFRDKTLEIQQEELLRGTVLNLLLQEKPNTVITFHEVWGGHPDHCAIGKTATAAFMEYQKTVSDARLFFVCSGDIIRNPERYALQKSELLEVDVSGCLQEKLLAFRAHVTQSQMNEWLWLDDAIAKSKLWGLEYFMPWNILNRL